MGFIIKVIIYAFAVFICAYFLPGVTVSDIGSLIIVATVLVLLNTFVKPVLVLLTLPFTIISLGLFVFIINTVLILVADALVPGFKVDGFLWAFVFSLILSILVWIFESFDKDEPKYKSKRDKQRLRD